MHKKYDRRLHHRLALAHAFSGIDWNLLNSVAEVNQLVDIFTAIVIDLKHKYIPIKLTKIGDKDHYWMSSEIKGLLKKRNPNPPMVGQVLIVGISISERCMRS
jgi:hypothetical protein